MFYHSGLLIAPVLKNSIAHVDKKTRKESDGSSVHLRRRTSRLRKVRWNIYQKMKLGEKDVVSVLGYYRSLIKRFLKRFSTKMKPREPEIWKEKLSKTAKDVAKFLRDEIKPDSTCKTSTLDSKTPSKVSAAFATASKPEKKETEFKKNGHARNVKLLPEQKCTCNTIMSGYMEKLDSALLMISTILHLVRNEQAKFEDRPFEVLAVETLDDDLEEDAAETLHDNLEEDAVETLDDNLEEDIETVDEPQVNSVAVDEASVKTLEITEARAQINPTPVNSYEVQSIKKPVDKDSVEYKERIKAASNMFLATLGVLDKTCPNGIHRGYAIVDCKCKVKVKQTGCPHKK